MNLKIGWSGRSHDYSTKEKEYLLKVLDSDNLTQGNEKIKFEKNLQNYIGKKNIFSINSAASALEIISKLINFKKNDEIIIPAHTYCASAIPFARNGAKVVWADIDFYTRTLSLDDVKKKITKKTKAIVIVHLYGFAVDVEKFKKINKNILIIEDCAQAFGAQINGKKVGSIGDFSCFSFHAQKNITTLGEGGAIYVKNKFLANKVSGLRHNGHCNYDKKRKNYWQPAMGNLKLDVKNVWPYKFTLSEIQCAAGWLMIKKLDQFNQKRINRAKKFVNHFKNSHLLFNESFKKKRHVYHLLSAYVKPTKNLNNHKLIDILYKKFGIKCAVQYYPLYKYDLFKKMGYGKAKCPSTEKFFNNMISFPFHLWMSDKKFNYMISSTKKALKILGK